MANNRELEIIAGIILVGAVIAYFGYKYFQNEINALILAGKSAISKSATSSSSTQANTTDLSGIYPSSTQANTTDLSGIYPSSTQANTNITISSQGAGTGALGSATNWYFPYANGWQGAGYYKSASQTAPEYIATLQDFEDTYPSAPTNSQSASTTNSISNLLGLNGINSQAQSLNNLTSNSSNTSIPPANVPTAQTYPTITMGTSPPLTAGAGTQSNPYKPFSLATQGIPVFYAGAGYYKSVFQTTPVYISSLSQFESIYIGSEYNNSVYIYE